jgi:DNA-binding response OmpR family regulator
VLDMLIVEADEATGAFLRDQLSADGYGVRVARSARHAIALAVQASPSLILLGDLEGRRDSLELIASIRIGSEAAVPLPTEVPILVLTARSGELDVLRAFEAGADDVIGKPFSYPELRARLRAVVRRALSPASSRLLTIGDLEIDTLARSVTVGATPVPLCRREYELLAHLATDPARVFTKRELLCDVWGFRADGVTRTLDSHACRLRRKLGGGGRQYVINVWGVGYCLHRPGAAPAAGSAALGQLTPRSSRSGAA